MSRHRRGGGSCLALSCFSPAANSPCYLVGLNTSNEAVGGQKDFAFAFRAACLGFSG